MCWVCISVVIDVGSKTGVAAIKYKEGVSLLMIRRKCNVQSN